MVNCKFAFYHCILVTVLHTCYLNLYYDFTTSLLIFFIVFVHLFFIVFIHVLFVCCYCVDGIRGWVSVEINVHEYSNYDNASITEDIRMVLNHMSDII